MLLPVLVGRGLSGAATILWVYQTVRTRQKLVCDVCHVKLFLYKLNKYTVYPSLDVYFVAASISMVLTRSAFLVTKSAQCSNAELERLLGTAVVEHKMHLGCLDLRQSGDHMVLCILRADHLDHSCDIQNMQMFLTEYLYYHLYYTQHLWSKRIVPLLA